MTPPSDLMGAHMPTSGGLFKAFGRGAEVGCGCMQIFTKSPNQWHAKELDDEAITAFRVARETTGIDPIVAHDSYLINLASPDATLRGKSIAAFLYEIDRCDRLRIPFLVTHPGAHKESGIERGIKTFVDSMRRIYDDRPETTICVLLETTAGQGSSLGYAFEQIATMIDGIGEKKRLGVCVDTCHIFSAGYDIRDPAGYEAVMRQFDKTIGISWVRCIHLNDSKKVLGSRVDRHEHIGEGLIGIDCFRSIMNDSRWSKVPKILETPKSEDLHEDVTNLKRLRTLVGKSSS